MIQLYTEHQPLIERFIEIDVIFTLVTHIDELIANEIVITDPKASREILQKHHDMTLLVLSDNPSFNEGSQLLALGVKGYGNTHMFKLHMQQAIGMLKSGNIWLYPSFMQELIQTIQPQNNSKERVLEKLTEREREIALHVSRGHSNKEIASALNITERTVKQHMSHIFEKLDILCRQITSIQNTLR